MTAQQDWRSYRNFSLYMITDCTLDLEATLCQVAAAVEGGVTCVQLRRPGAQPEQIHAFAQALISLLAPTGIPLIINDHPSLAVEAGAAGVHVGQSNMATDHARAIIGPGRLLGLSVTDICQMDHIREGVVDYLGAGPVWHTSSKANPAPPIGVAGLAGICRRASVPVVAIGGISLNRIPCLKGCDLAGIAVISALSQAGNPCMAARDLASAFGQTVTPS